MRFVFLVVTLASICGVTASQFQNCNPSGTFESYVSSQMLAFKRNLDATGTVVLTWNLTESGALHARMINNGRVGWMGIGIRNQGGRYNGMLGASVLIAALNDNSFTNATVNEFKIDSSSTDFKDWNTPLSTSSSLTSKEFSNIDCFSKLEFVTSHIGGLALSTTAGIANDFIWAVHSTSWEVEYHDKRGITNVDLSTGNSANRFIASIFLLFMALHI